MLKQQAILKACCSAMLKARMLSMALWKACSELLCCRLQLCTA